VQGNEPKPEKNNGGKVESGRKSNRTRDAQEHSGGGNGILPASILSRYPRASGILVDFSGPVISQAQALLKSHRSKLRCVVADLAEKVEPC